MSAAGGTYRGATPKRGQLPFDTSSPSGIPRPTHAHSEISGTSTLSASRQKQSKRDEVGLWLGAERQVLVLTLTTGNSTEDGGRPQ